MLKLMRRVAAGGWWLGVFLAQLAAGAPAPAKGSRFAIDAWRTEDGLPQSSVIAMTLSRDGYLWLGTLSGLVRFDGFRFPVFDESTPGLGSSRIVHLFEDGQGNLWIGTETAGIVLARPDGSITNVALGRPGREGRLMAACEDTRGGVWLYTADGQLGCYEGGHLESAPVDETPFSYCRSLIVEDEGRVLAGTDERLYVLSASARPERQSWPKEERIRYGKLDYLLASRRGGHWRMGDGRIQRWTSKGLVEDLGPYPWSQVSPDPLKVAISSACEDPQGRLLIATLGAGLFWFEGEGKPTQLSTKEGLASNFLLSLQFDREGTLWVGTDGDGLNQVRRQLFDVLEPSRGRVVQSVCEDAQGEVWIGYNSGGVDRWREGQVRAVNTGEDMLSMSVKTVFVSRDQRVWAGTENPFMRPPGLFQLTGERFARVATSLLYNRDVAAMFEDRSGRLWIGTRSGLVRWDPKEEWRGFSTADGLSANAVSAIAEDSDGAIWIGTRGGGLNRMQHGRFTAFHKSDGLPSEEVSSLYVDGDGTLWVGTDGGGLGRCKAGKWRSFSKADGLASNNIAYLLEDDEGYLWLGSTAGLMRVFKRLLNDLAERSNKQPAGQPRGASAPSPPPLNQVMERRDGPLPLRVYGVSDGLPISECTQGSQPAACRMRSGQLLFPTVRGLATVEPAQLHANTNPPPVTIESILLEGRPTGPEGLLAPRRTRVTVPPGQEHLEIHYTSLNLASAKLARFRYRLEGHENAWVDVGGTRSAHYSKLPPGQYLFRVSACNEDGVWNEAGATLAVIVQPPLWRTWWFLTASALTFLGAVVGVVRYFSVQKLERQLAVMRQQEALEKERARIARDIHDQLGASLTQVALLGELVEADKELPHEIEAHAKQICQTARDTTRTLDEIVWTVNPSNDTIEGLANYVCKYAQDYLGVAGIRYRLEVPPDLPPAPIPPEVRHNVFLAAKEAITNVVRHARATSAWIRLKHDPARFTFEIADDGRGLAGMDPQRVATRNGLRNMRRRMEDVGGQFEMGAAPEGGLQIRLTVPVGQ